MDGLYELLFVIRHNKVRTLLTAFGVFWGIFLLILLLGAGKGIQNGIMSGFANTVPDFIVIYSGTTSLAYKGLGIGRRVNLLESDVDAIKNNITGVRVISSAITMGSTMVNHGGKNGNFEIMGIADEYFDVKAAISFGHGRSSNPLDNQQARKVGLIGTAVAKRLFGENSVNSPVGQLIKIRGVAIVIVGIFHDGESNGLASERVYLPISTYKKIFGGGNTIRDIWMRPDAGVDALELEKKVVDLIKRRHDVAPKDRRAIKSFNMAEPTKRVKNLFLGIDLFIWFVGLGTFVAGIVGVSNIMIIAVKERTREIGIRKALGATPFNIVGNIVLESVLVTSIAGYAGLVVGVALLELIMFVLQSASINLAFFKNPEVDFQRAFIAIFILVVMGALAGLIPALKAARIMPIEAMRS